MPGEELHAVDNHQPVCREAVPWPSFAGLILTLMVASASMAVMRRTAWRRLLVWLRPGPRRSPSPRDLASGHFHV